MFIVLLTRAILSFGLNFYMPVSKVDENMKRAHRRDAINTERFFFRRELYRTRNRHHSRNGSSSRSVSQPGSGQATPVNGSGTVSPDRTSFAEAWGPVEDEMGEYTMDELINGKVREPCLRHGTVLYSS